MLELLGELAIALVPMLGVSIWMSYFKRKTKVNEYDLLASKIKINK